MGKEITRPRKKWKLQQENDRQAEYIDEATALPDPLRAGETSMNLCDANAFREEHVTHCFTDARERETGM